MNMKIGGRYKILNHVVEFEEGRRIAWRHFGGHIWRYILEPVGENSTVVTEQFDPRDARSPLVLKIIRATPRNQKAIDRTLNRLVEWASYALVGETQAAFGCGRSSRPCPELVEGP